MSNSFLQYVEPVLSAKSPRRAADGIIDALQSALFPIRYFLLIVDRNDLVFPRTELQLRGGLYGMDAMA